MDSRKKNGEYLTQLSLDKLKVKFQIERILDENKILRVNTDENKKNIDLYIKAQLFNNQEAILPIQTARLKLLSNNEHIIFNYYYSDLQYNAFIALTLWTTSKQYDECVPLGSTIVSLFDGNLRLREGKHNLIVWPDTVPDTSNASFTPGLVSDANIKELNYSLLKQVEFNKMTSPNYNDNLSINTLFNKIFYTYKKVPASFIEIEFPKFTLPVYFEEKEYQNFELNNSILNKTANSKIPQNQNDFSEVVIFSDFDHDLGRNNPVESHWYLILRDDENPRQLSPNREEIDRIEKILRKPNFGEMKEEEQILIWRFRYTLQYKNYALTKFLHSVKWHTQKEEEEAFNMLKDWAKIDSDDALHLLSGAFCANDYYGKKISKKPISAIMKIRSYAVEILMKESDKKLALILLQMVQALRYEKFDGEEYTETETTLTNFLMNRVKNDLTLSTLFYWYISVECDDKGKKDNNKSIVSNYYEKIRSDFTQMLSDEKPEFLESLTIQTQLRDKLKEINEKIKKLDSNLKKKEELKKIASQKEFQKNEFKEQPLCLNPSFYVTSMEPEECIVFKSAMAPLRLCFKAYQPEFKEKGETKYKVIFKSGDDLRQDQLIIQMITLMDSLLKGVNVDCVLTPYKVLACSKSDGFLEFVPDSGTLQDIGKDSTLTSYFQKLADLNKPKEETNINDSTISNDPENKDKKNKIIQNYNNNPFFNKILNNFISSCAGYCVITYFLGVGDRHKENLMINKEGKFFHIDFGFILGKDPKPYPPPLKLCPEMVEGMGGKNSEGYKMFQKKCVECYLYLRKYSKLILNLFQLMLDSGIKDITQEALENMNEKFYLDENEENAEKHFLEIIETSTDALFPKITDKFHEWVVYWRK